MGRREWGPRAREMDDGRAEIERMETGRHRGRETELQDLETQGESERLREVCYTEWVSPSHPAEGFLSG